MIKIIEGKILIQVEKNKSNTYHHTLEGNKKKIKLDLNGFFNILKSKNNLQ